MYRALIVCNSRFGNDPVLSELHGPKVDGTLIRDALTDHESGMFDKNEVKFVPEQKQQQVCDSIEEFFESAEPDDTLLFYYSGHGLIKNQQFFLCTADTITRKPVSTAVSESMLNNIVANSYAQSKIIILDCCHSGKLKDDGIIKNLSGTGRYIIAAASATERATDARFRGLPSPFTRILADGLTTKADDRDDDGYVDLDDIYDYLKRTPFEGPQPQRNFAGRGAISIARRTLANRSRPQVGDDTVTSQSNGTLPRESALPVLSYMDTVAPKAVFNPEQVSQFRGSMKGDTATTIPAQLSDREFLEHIGVMRDGSLTYAGVLLFGKNPGTLFPAAIIQCVRFYGTTKTAPLDAIEIRGTVAESIVQARDFVARHARIGESPTAQSSYAETAYRYPMVAVREVIANAVVHRDYEDQISCVQIHLFEDRLEIINPGQLAGTPVLPAGEIPLSQLERRSQRRNFRLAQTLGLSKLVEGVGAGIPRAIADSNTVRAQEPVVVTDDRSVTVTIFPGEPEEILGLRAEPERAPYGTRTSGQRKPMYLAIADDLRKQINDGIFSPGAQIPTEGELRDRYDASRNTIRDAIRRLISEGLIETRLGQGTFVTRKVDPFITVLTANPQQGFGDSYLSAVQAGYRQPRATLPKVEILTPGEAISRRLRVPLGTQMVSRHQARFIDEIPWSLQTSFYPMEMITKGATQLLMAANIEEGTVRYLADTLDLRQVGYRDWITARTPNDDEQQFFGLAHDAAVFEVFRTAFDQHAMPMRVTVTVFPADRNQLVVDVGDALPDPQFDTDSIQP